LILSSGFEEGNCCDSRVTGFLPSFPLTVLPYFFEQLLWKLLLYSIKWTLIFSRFRKITKSDS